MTRFIEVKFCEFIGDETSPWDGTKKQRCSQIGFNRSGYVCMKHSEHLQERHGWLVCSPKCSEPIHTVKTLK